MTASMEERNTILHQEIIEHRRAEEELSESKQKLSLHFEQTPLGVIEWDLNFKVTVWNKAAETIFGFTKEEAIGKHAIELIVPNQAKATVDQVWENPEAGYADTILGLGPSGIGVDLWSTFDQEYTDADGNLILTLKLVVAGTVELAF